MPATVVETRREAADARTLLLEADVAPTLAGQHVDIRLTAEDGYTAQRSYSVGSAAGAARLEVTVVRFDDGEVSPYLVEDVEVGDMIEVRGPIGGWFVWLPEQTEPVQLIAGGSGVVPLMAMIRTHAAAGSTAPFRLLYGSTGPEHEFYGKELDALAGPALAVTRRYSRFGPDAGRITPALLAEVTHPPEVRPTVYICGGTAFVEAMADALVAQGHEAARIRTERFGPTG